MIIDVESFKTKLTKKDRKDPISVIKYSPNGKFLAVGGVDGIIYIYDPSNKFALKYSLKGHVSRVTHLDFDLNSEVIQSCSSSYDLLYHSLSNSKLVQGGASAYKDTEWSTWNIIFGWPVQGIWPPCSSGDDINSVDLDNRR
jgi:WD40 repeat protein